MSVPILKIWVDVGDFCRNVFGSKNYLKIKLIEELLLIITTSSQEIVQMQTSRVNLLEVSSKAQSKPEMYRLLTVEEGLYLPPQDQTNMEFISDIAFQVKKVSLSNVVDSSIKFNRRLM